MPISHQKNIYSVLAIVDDLQKRKGVVSILDIGAGFGKYGLLLRERLDVRFKRYNKEDWITRIDAVEGYAPYITPVHRYVYDSIFTNRIEDIIDKLPRYDVILMIDCLEHLEKVDGIELLIKLDAMTEKMLILSFPNIYQVKAGADWDNSLERHRCLWTPEDVEATIGTIKRHKSTIYVKNNTDRF